MAKLRVLLVEDEIDIQFIVNLVLMRSGLFEVTAFGSGVEALDHVSSETSVFDLILVNFRLPTMNGLEFLQVIRSNPSYASLPAIVISAGNVGADTPGYDDAGVIGTVQKPFDIDTLPQQIVGLYEAAGQQT